MTEDKNIVIPDEFSVIIHNLADTFIKHNMNVPVETLNAFVENIFNLYNDEEFDPEDNSEAKTEGVLFIESDDEIISFEINRQVNEYVTVICPHCKNDEKFKISTYSDGLYIQKNCKKCNKQFLTQLDFTPIARTYVLTEG